MRLLSLLASSLSTLPVNRGLLHFYPEMWQSPEEEEQKKIVKQWFISVGQIHQPGVLPLGKTSLFKPFLRHFPTWRTCFCASSNLTTLSIQIFTVLFSNTEGENGTRLLLSNKSSYFICQLFVPSFFSFTLCSIEKSLDLVGRLEKTWEQPSWTSRSLASFVPKCLFQINKGQWLGFGPFCTDFA